MNRICFACLALLLALPGCSRVAPTATVEVIDTSLSITPRAEKAALDAVEHQIDHLGRGDTLILIPITGDTENNAAGRILRLQASATREPYDADLRRFRDQAGKQFAAWAASVRAESNRTDILGALDAATQEVAALPKGVKRRVVVVSDFLEDDARYRFTTESALARPSTARRLAIQIRAERGFALGGARTCLGRLESRDFATLSPVRRESIDSFWKAYLAGDGHEPEVQIDGLELLDDAENVCSKGFESSNQKGKDAQ